MENKNLMEINSQNIGYMDSVHEYQKLFINNKIGEALQILELNVKRTITLCLNYKNIKDIWRALEEKYTIYSISKEHTLIVDEKFMADLVWNYKSSHNGILLTISAKSIDDCERYIDMIKVVLSEYIVNASMINYRVIQYENGNLNSTGFLDNSRVNFNPLTIPFIENIDSYIEKFLNSNSPILILQGEGGTGKTTFSKYILQKMNEIKVKEEQNLKALYSFDENIFYAPQFFKDILYDDHDVIVLEDINQMIHKNQEATDLNPINKFISVTDGLISKNTKIVITTNIDSKHQLNELLIRPGRCFDVLKFRKLHGVEIDNLCDSYNKDLDLQIESINLSEFFARCNNDLNSDMTNSKIGFN